MTLASGVALGLPSPTGCLGEPILIVTSLICIVARLGKQISILIQRNPGTIILFSFDAIKGEIHRLKDYCETLVIFAVGRSLGYLNFIIKNFHYWMVLFQEGLILIIFQRCRRTGRNFDSIIITIFFLQRY